MAEAGNEQAPKRDKRTGRPVVNVTPKERMAFNMDCDLAFKVRLLALEQKKTISAVFNDLVRAAPEPDIQACIQNHEGMSPKRSRSKDPVKKEPVVFWMEPELADKVRAIAFVDSASNSKVGSDLVRAAPAPKNSAG